MARVPLRHLAAARPDADQRTVPRPTFLPVKRVWGRYDSGG